MTPFLKPRARWSSGLFCCKRKRSDNSGQAGSMNRLIVFLIGAATSTVSELFWRGTSSRSIALWGGTSMLMLRRILLRFSFVNRALLCICSTLPLMSLGAFIHILSRLCEGEGKRKPFVFLLEKPSFSYGLYRFFLLAPAYTIIEYLEAWLSM